MQLPQPYLYTSERMVAVIDRSQMAPSEGIIADSVFGYHTLWAAEVPFIPAQVKEKGGNFELEAANGLKEVMQRQVRFLYDLAQSRNHQATFEMRLISRPQPNGPTRVGIVFLGKVFDTDATVSQQLALGLWDKFSALFPREAPFSYPLVPVAQLDSATPGQPCSFMDWFQPFPFEHLNRPQSLVELRKYEDWPAIRDIGRVLHPRDYIPHPFVAALDHSAMARLFETMARQQQVTVVAITLRPQRLTDQEVLILHEFSGWYKRAPNAEPDIVLKNRLIQKWRDYYSDSIKTYKSSRAELGKKVYDELVKEHRSLFLLRLQVVGDPVVQDDIIEALGSEVMANAGNEYPSRWERIEAATGEELYWARFNLQWLEFARWGISPIIEQDRRIIRLRQLVTIVEAAGAFRLPLAPSRGGLAGVDVRDEPFTLPTTTLASTDDARSTLGTLIDRGVPTTLKFSIPSSAQAGQAQIFGDRSEYRGQLVEKLLATNGGPWILLRQGTTDGEQIAQRLAARYIALDSTAPKGDLGFHPLLPPPGVALSRFLDTLVRVLLTVCALDLAAMPLLRQALYETYESAGWREHEVGHSINLMMLAERIDAIAKKEIFTSNVVMAVRTRCVPTLQDLALTTAHLQQPSLATEEAPWLKPIIIDVGWLGGELNNALFYGCLWIWYALALAADPGSASKRRSLLALEDAHMLFSPVKSPQPAIAPLAALIHASSQAGTNILLIDDRPDLFDSEVTNRATVTILTSSATTSVRESGAKLMGASPSQQSRIARMSATEAVVKLQSIAPVLIGL
ncbi:MAG TPA: hypothetical protein VKR06_19600 [Ktedonosporobacter sp.]|nr:hypothetical protein [Ktedonosporobacter sp.]